MRELVKKLDASSRLAPAMLARAPSFCIAAGALADQMPQVQLSNGETVHLRLPHHTHLNPGDVLLDSMGMMVRIEAAPQAVLSVGHAQASALVALALGAMKQGRALGWANDCLLLAHDTTLQQHLSALGYTVNPQQGTLNIAPTSLPLPEHACGHGDHAAHHEHAGHHHGHDHSHDHGHSH